MIGGYHQVALLLHSVQDEVAGPYLDALDDAGIPARCVPAGSGRGEQGPEPLPGSCDRHDHSPVQGP